MQACLKQNSNANYRKIINNFPKLSEKKYLAVWVWTVISTFSTRNLLQPKY